MANKFHNGPAGKTGGKAAYSEQSDGPSGSTVMPMKTADWPGLPGKKGPDRSNGTPQRGYCGNFNVKSIMSPEVNPRDLYSNVQAAAGVGGLIAPARGQDMRTPLNPYNYMNNPLMRDFNAGPVAGAVPTLPMNLGPVAPPVGVIPVQEDRRTALNPYDYMNQPLMSGWKAG